MQSGLVADAVGAAEIFAAKVVAHWRIGTLTPTPTPHLPLEEVGFPTMLQPFLAPPDTRIASSAAGCVGLKLHLPRRWPCCGIALC